MSVSGDHRVIAGRSACWRPIYLNRSLMEW